MKMKNENENSSRYSPVQQSSHRIPTPRRTTTATAHITPVTALAPNNKDIHCIRTRIRIIACTLLCTYLPPPTHTPTTITPYSTMDPHSYPRADPPRPPLIPMTDPDAVGALYRIASYRIVSFWPSLPPVAISPHHTTTPYPPTRDRQSGSPPRHRPVWFRALPPPVHPALRSPRLGGLGTRD